jgi:predicted N-formylglutamate amidohydrolase
MARLLTEGEADPVEIVNADGRSPYVVLCEHAGNAIPKGLGTLGLSQGDLTRHIAWDIGAAGVSRKLSGLLGAPLVLQRYSRLVYDCNRPPESAGAMPETSETTPIPGNLGLSAANKRARLDEICRPFHTAAAKLLDQRAVAGMRTAIVTIHSFTPVYHGQKRDVELGLLFDRDSWMAEQLVGQFPGIDARLNEPYAPKDGVMHTILLHAAPRGLRSLMIEVRNDLISDEQGQENWARRLAAPLMAMGADI